MWIKELLNKQKAKARYGVTLAKLEYLSLDFLGDRASKVDKKHWEEELKNLEEYSMYIEEAVKEMQYYKSIFEQYLKKYHQD